MPVVTVIMPAYQAAATIAEAIESVRRQTWQDWELIVVDDASTDGTGDIARKAAAGDPRIRVRRNETNQGAATSMNLAWKSTDSRYVAILDADDIAMPERLEVQVGRMEADPAVDLLGGSAHFVDFHGRYLRTVSFAQDDATLRGDRWYRCPFLHSTVMMRRRVLEALGGYAEDLRLCEDYDLWMRGFAAGGFGYANLPGVLAVYRGRTIQRWEMIKASASARRRAGVREGRRLVARFAAWRILVEGALEQTGYFAWHARRYSAPVPGNLYPAARTEA